MTTIMGLMNQVEEGEVVLPAIQRDFVWGEDQTVKLLDSVMRGYPIGIALLWETYNDIQYRSFVSDFRSGTVHTYKDNRRKNRIRVVLDGQQRLQSLFIALRGKRDGSELYLNVLSGKEDEDLSDERFLFEFMQDAEAKRRNVDTEEEIPQAEDIEDESGLDDDEERESDDPLPEWWVAVSDLFAMGAREKQDYVRSLGKRLALSEESELLLERNLTVFDEVLTRDQNILKLSTIDENLPSESPYRQTEADVLEIFVRINREGTPLSRSDLIFSMLKLGWKESAEGMPEFVEAINQGNSFDLDTDFVVRCLFAVSELGGRLNIDLLRNKENVARLQANFAQCCDAIRATVDFVKRECRCESSRLLGSPSTLVPLVSYLRERLVAARELLSETGSVFVQIGPDNLHLVRNLLDEIFGSENACPFITVQKTSGHDSRLLPEVCDYLLWYAKDHAKVKYRHLFERRIQASGPYRYVELHDGTRREMTADERATNQVPDGARIFRYDNITSQGTSRQFTFEFEGRTFHPGRNAQWKIRREGMEGLARAKRLGVVGNTLSYVRYLDDFGAVRRTNVWTDTVRAGFARKKQFVVETNPKIVERVIAMATDAGDLVLDPTCGSGTTAWCAEKLGRRWITVDTSRVALAIARERLLASKFDYYKLRNEERGIDGGLEYETLKRVTASSVGYGTDPDIEILYDQPQLDRSKVRVSGPFTMESLSRYVADPLESNGAEASSAQDAADHVEVLLDALRTQGIPRENGKPTEVVTLTPISGDGILHAEGAYRNDEGNEERFAVSLGPRHGPIAPIQVDEALKEAPGYDLVVFAGFAATSEAQEYLSTGRRGRYKVALLEANPDLLLGDLLKQTKASQTFRLFASPDAEIRAHDDAEFIIELLGMDTFDTATGEVTSRDRDQIAAWLLDTDYDATVFHANQAFFTREKAWDPLAKALNGTVDEEAIARLHSFESLPFKRPDSGRVAIRVIDDAGSTSERIIEVPA